MSFPLDCICQKVYSDCCALKYLVSVCYYKVAHACRHPQIRLWLIIVHVYKLYLLTYRTYSLSDSYALFGIIGISSALTKSRVELLQLDLPSQTPM